MSGGEPATAAPVEPGRLRTDVLITYGGKVATLVFSLVISVLLARQLGPSGRGTLAVAFSFAQILAQLGSLGLATANPYFAASRQAPVGRLVTTSLWLSGVVGVTFALVGAAVYALAPEVVGGIDWATLAIALAMIPAMLASLFLQSLLLGEGRMVEYSSVEIGQGLVTLVALLVGFFAYDLSAAGALAVMCATTYGAAVVMLVLLREHGPFVDRPDARLIRSLLGYGVKVYATTILAFLVIRLDILLVNGYLGSSNAGVYAVVAGLAEGMYLFPAVIGLNLFTRIARGGETGMTAEIFRTIAVLYGLLCLLSIPLAAPAISVMYGPQFSEAAELYYWIVPGVYSLGLLTIISHHLAGRGFPIEAMLIWVVGLAVNIVMNVLWLPDHGLYIASLASSVAYILLLLLHMRLLSRETGGWRTLIPRLGEVGRFLRTASSRRVP